MAEDQDKSQKTEDPTAKKLSEAFKKGNVPKSQEINNWFMLAASGLVVALFAGSIASGLRPGVIQFLQLPHDIPTDVGHLSLMFGEIGWTLIKLLVLPVLILLIAAVLGNMIQHKPVVSLEKIKPQLNKVSPKNGLKRMFGSRGAVDLGKAVAKILITGAAAALVVLPSLGDLPLFVQMELIDIVHVVQRNSLLMLLAVVGVLTLIAGLDLAYQRYDWFQGLKMSRQDVKDEHKQAEGDPHVKSRIRQIRSERARHRIAAAVPTADAVVTNPTHFAVALKYDAETMSAPTVVAKGQDHLALRIRELAEEHEVPLVENPPLARGLYHSVELDREVPPQFYKAVAEVISYVMRLKRKMPPHRHGVRGSTGTV